jgi:hypothetical protein
MIETMPRGTRYSSREAKLKAEERDRKPQITQTGIAVPTYKSCLQKEIIDNIDTSQRWNNFFFFKYQCMTIFWNTLNRSYVDIHQYRTLCSLDIKQQHWIMFRTSSCHLSRSDDFQCRTKNKVKWPISNYCNPRTSSYKFGQAILRYQGKETWHYMTSVKQRKAAP